MTLLGPALEPEEPCVLSRKTPGLPLKGLICLTTDWEAVAQLVECLSSMHEARASIPNTAYTVWTMLAIPAPGS